MVMFLIVAFVFFLPYLLLTLCALFDKDKEAWKVWLKLHKHNLPKYHIFFLFACGYVGWLACWVFLLGRHYACMDRLEDYFGNARRRADRLWNHADDHFSAVLKPFNVK